MCTCADDVGLCLRDLTYLDKVSDIFMRTRGVTGLVLGAAKCVIVPLWAALEHAKQQVQEYLDAYLPHWSVFKITDNARYLGFMLGPGSTIFYKFFAAMQK